MNKNNQNNNGKSYNNNNFNSRKKVARQPKVNPNEIKASLFLPANLNENIKNEILDVLATTKFNKISIPLGTYRFMIDSNISEDDNRICTIGYIRNYNADTKEFTVVIFSKFIDLVKGNSNVAIELQFTEYKENLGTITKFNIIPVIVDYEVEPNEIPQE